jgi:hypothetical protein
MSFFRDGSTGEMDVDAMVHACMGDSIGASRMHMGLSIGRV